MFPIDAFQNTLTKAVRILESLWLSASNEEQQQILQLSDALGLRQLFHELLAESNEVS